MTVIEKLEPKAVASILKSGEAVLIDIREPDEFAREHIEGAISLPLSRLESGAGGVPEGQTCIFHCKSGMRTEANCARLEEVSGDGVRILKGGLDAWKKAGLPTVKDVSAPLPIMRQVQIAAGTLVLIGVILGQTIHPGFVYLSAFVGAGLLFAGLSGWCGMANLLSIMPWNRKQRSA